MITTAALASVISSTSPPAIHASDRISRATGPSHSACGMIRAPGASRATSLCSSRIWPVRFSPTKSISTNAGSGSDFSTGSSPSALPNHWPSVACNSSCATERADSTKGCAAAARRSAAACSARVTGLAVTICTVTRPAIASPIAFAERASPIPAAAASRVNIIRIAITHGVGPTGGGREAGGDAGRGRAG
jgi:hypothetical protein